MERFEVIIVGGGIAGASVAWALAEHGLGDVLLLEKEDQPGFHATGRSAAVLVALDGNPTVQELKLLSIPFFRDPPDGFAENPLLAPSGILVLFGEPAWSRIQRTADALMRRSIRVEPLVPAEARARVEVLRAEQFDGALLFPEEGGLDVHELLTGFLRGARRRGVQIRCGVEVGSIIVQSGRCAGVSTDSGEIRSEWVVDATGAWAGRIGTGAGASRIDISPKLRCVITTAPPSGLETHAWPFVKSEAHCVYFKPEAGAILMSPMDEEPSPPCDARPDELAIAHGVERLRNLAPRIVPEAIARRWAGLRSFAPDGAPVVGEDPLLPGLFWMAGQGGSGIVTSPVLGSIAADLILAGKTDRFPAGKLSPARTFPK